MSEAVNSSSPPSKRPRLESSVNGTAVSDAGHVFITLLLSPCPRPQCVGVSVGGHGGVCLYVWPGVRLGGAGAEGT